MKNIFSLIIFLMVFTLGSLAGQSVRNFSFIGDKYFSNKSEKVATVYTLIADKQDEVSDEEIKIAFTGDIMLDRGVKSKVEKRGEGNYGFVFENIKDDLNNYDLLVGNLEGPISDKGYDRQGLYSFRMDPQAISALKEANFGALSIANNHINNWGLEALKDTILRLSESGIKVLGGGMNEKEAYGEKIVEIDGVKISLLAFSDFTDGPDGADGDLPGIALISGESIEKNVAEARKKSDIVVVNFHFGEEYQAEQNSRQEKFAKMAIDFGADLVVGHHPHVVQPIERYRNSYIAYSLGNFVFDQPFSEETMGGGLLEVTIKDKSISDVVLKKIKINNNFQPSLI